MTSKNFEDDIPILRAKNFTIITKIGREWYKIFQIHFQKRDGTIIIDFPYYKKCSGLLCRVELSDKIQYPTSVDFTEGGKVTSQSVKFSYHPDGNVHFSQDRKILTVIKKRTVPLIDATGHFFTIQINGPEDFKIHSEESKYANHSHKRRYLLFEFPISFEGSIKFLGYYSHISELGKSMVSRTSSERYIFISSSTGEQYPGFIIGPPLGYPLADKVMEIICKEIPTMTADNSSCLTFVSGFDDLKIAFDHTKTTTFLGLMYPTDDFNELKEKIGSVDFSEN